MAKIQVYKFVILKDLHGIWRYYSPYLYTDLFYISLLITLAFKVEQFVN